MARLTRKNIKVFAGNATNNGVFGSLQAENPVTTTNVEQIQSLPAWSVGWNSATMTSEKLPPLEEFQGIQYVTTYQQAYLMQEGMPEWASTVTYYKGSLTKEVTSNGFRIYYSLTNDNTNNLLSDTSNWKKVMDSSDLYAYDSAVVHLAGTETITGAKTFTSNVTQSSGSPREILKNTDCVKGTAPASNEAMSVQFKDNNNNLLGTVQTNYETTKKIVTQLRAYKAHSASDTDSVSIGVGYTANGNRYSWAPTPTLSSSDSSYSEQIATVGWIDGSNSNLVHRTGDETIAGTKTFSRTISGSINGNAATVTNGVYTTGDQTIGGTKTFKASPAVNISQPIFRLQSSTITKGTAPASDTELGWYNFEDNAGRSMGRLRYYYNQDKSSAIQMTAYQANSSGDSNSASIRVVYPAGGGAYATAPASDVNGSILTTVNKSKSANGYFQLGNGMIVQWGRVEAGVSTTPSITFPKAFTSATSYSFASTPYSASNTNASTEHLKAYSKTGVTLFCGPGWNPIFWIAIGY